jgi:hypothetical protein
MKPYSYSSQYIGEAMAANAVTAASLSGRPTPVHFCSICGYVSPVHSPMCEYPGVNAAYALAAVAGGLRLS